MIVENESNTVSFITMLDEIEECLKAIKTKTSELGYEVNEAALSGYSAGGHLALLYSYSRIENSPIPLKFVFEQTGPADFHSDSWWGAGGEFLTGAISAYSGTPITEEMIENGEAEQYINLISPIYYINENTIPTLCAYGKKDDLVTTVNSGKLLDALEKNNVKHDFIYFPNSNHGLYSDPELQDEYHKKVLEYANKYFEN